MEILYIEVGTLYILKGNWIFNQQCWSWQTKLKHLKLSLLHRWSTAAWTIACSIILKIMRSPGRSLSSTSLGSVLVSLCGLVLMLVANILMALLALPGWLLSPSGDLGISLVWHNLSGPDRTGPPTFWSDCWNPLQTELNYLGGVLSCFQDDIRWF